MTRCRAVCILFNLTVHLISYTITVVSATVAKRVVNLKHSWWVTCIGCDLCTFSIMGELHSMFCITLACASIATLVPGLTLANGLLVQRLTSPAIK